MPLFLKLEISDGKWYYVAMKLFAIDIDYGVELAGRVDLKYKSVFDKFGAEQRAAMAYYFLPHKSKKDILGVNRPRVIKWYCPFADQRQFPSGHRYCINVYSGCSHQCQYCYAQGYEPRRAKCKDNYKSKLLKDLSELEEYNVPAAPVHLSNSTDPLQMLELKHRMTLYTLKQLRKYRRFFTSIVILTKNPALLVEPEYLEALKLLVDLPLNHSSKEKFTEKSLPGLRVETSLAFCGEQYTKLYDPGAPSVGLRMSAIVKLRNNGIPVVMRIDPLLPRNPLRGGKLLADFQLPDAQSLEALEELVGFAAKSGVMHIVYSVAKIVLPRSKPFNKSMQRLKQVYEYIVEPEKLIFRGGSWRLQHAVAQEHIVRPFLEICRRYNIKAVGCKQNLVSTP